MVKVSVIVPVYNVENYLRECLDSIINQTFTDLEIICINDGSTDNSLEILMEYESNDDRITVINQENMGHAVATNNGIEVATGECLFFMDSDDIIELNALEISYDKLKEKDADFVMFKVMNYDDINGVYYETKNYSMEEIYDKVGDNVFNYHDIDELMFESCVCPWNKLYKREFVMENNIRFPKGLIFDDNVFYYNALLSANKICFIDEFLFIRRWYSKSSTTTGDIRFISSLDISNLIIDIFKDKNEFDNYKINLLNNKISINFMRYNKIKKEFKQSYFKAMREDFIKILKNEELYEDLIETLTYRNRRIFEQVIISENSIELDLLRKTYDTQMKNYKLFNSEKIFKDIIKTSIDNYLTLNDNKKEIAFETIRNNFIEILLNEGLCTEIMNHIEYSYQKLFEQVIISENSLEFEKLRKSYDIQMKSYALINNNIYNNLMSLLDKRIIYADNNYKKELFDNSKNFLIDILNNDLLYNGFFNGINYTNQKRFNQMLISENCEEYLLLRDIYDTKMKMNNKITTLKNKLEDYMEIKDFNDKLVHSNSWKITRPFRII